MYTTLKFNLIAEKEEDLEIMKDLVGFQ